MSSKFFVTQVSASSSKPSVNLGHCGSKGCVALCPPVDGLQFQSARKEFLRQAASCRISPPFPSRWTCHSFPVTSPFWCMSLGQISTSQNTMLARASRLSLPRLLVYMRYSSVQWETTRPQRAEWAASAVLDLVREGDAVLVPPGDTCLFSDLGEGHLCRDAERAPIMPETGLALPASACAQRCRGSWLESSCPVA